MTEPSAADVMRAIGVLEGTVKGLALQMADVNKHLGRIEEKANRNAISTAKLYTVAGIAMAGGGLAGWLSKMLG